MSSTRLTPPVGESDHLSGPADAPVTLVEYGDFECSSCGRAHLVVQSLQRELGDSLRFVYRHFPRDKHPHAQHAAEAAEAAGVKGKFWEMHDLLFQHQKALEDNDLIAYGSALGLDTEQMASDFGSGRNSGRVRDDFVSGVRSGVNRTPALFINGERFEEAWSDEAAFLRALREAAGRARK